MEEWTGLYQYLFAKFVDGNIKRTKEGKFVNNGFDETIPAYPEQPGYNESYYRKIVETTGDHLKVINKEQ